MQRVIWLGQLARITDDRWVKVVLMRGEGGKDEMKNTLAVDRRKWERKGKTSTCSAIYSFYKEQKEKLRKMRRIFESQYLEETS